VWVCVCVCVCVCVLCVCVCVCVCVCADPVSRLQVPRRRIVACSRARSALKTRLASRAFCHLPVGFFFLQLRLVGT
jgi:hypothetical protein